MNKVTLCLLNSLSVSTDMKTGFELLMEHGRNEATWVLEDRSECVSLIKLST